MCNGLRRSYSLGVAPGQTFSRSHLTQSHVCRTASCLRPSPLLLLLPSVCDQAHHTGDMVRIDHPTPTAFCWLAWSQATHNMRSFAGEYPPGMAAPKELQFVTWLKETATDPAISPEERRRRLAKWASEAPHGRLSHPREEHLLPLHVVAGCTGFSPGVTLYDGWVLGAMSLACVGYWGSGAAGDGAAGGSGSGSDVINQTLEKL